MTKNVAITVNDLYVESPDWARSRHPDFGAESLSWVVNGAAHRNSLSVRCVPVDYIFNR
jgi:hypothetical protein